MKSNYRTTSFIIGLLFLLSIFSFLPSVAAYSPSGTHVLAGQQLSFKPGNAGHKSSFTCPTIPGADSSVCSTNWSGYADTAASGSVSAVSGSWTVPTLSCPPSGTTYDAIWVGIDGYSSSTVEQTGVLGECNNGLATYSTWYEFYPNPMYSTSVTVIPGDVVSASVTYSSTTSEFTITITNTNTHAQATASLTVSGAARSSAEWIVERPALCTIFRCTLSTLANFGSQPFTASSATIGTASGSISAFSDVAITMVGGNKGPVLAEPSPLQNEGTSFTVLYG